MHDNIGLHLGRFDTADLPETDARQAYLDRLDGILDTDFLQPFGARLDAYRMGAFNVLILTASARRSTRTRARIDHDRYGAIGVQYIVSGHAVGNADGRPVASEPGTVMILDYARPFSITDQEARTVVNIALPRDAFPGDTTETMEWHGAVLSGPAIAPLSQFMTTLDQALPSVPAAAGPILADAFKALLTVALGEAPAAPITTPEAQLIRRAGQLIDDRIASPDLDPAWLANKLKVSRTELYGVLEQFGGVARFILQRRLARARAALEDPTDRRRIGVIAYAYGFPTEAGFARSFRAAFGTTARAVQQAARNR